jgi:hypothetical protein
MMKGVQSMKRSIRGALLEPCNQVTIVAQERGQLMEHRSFSFLTATVLVLSLLLAASVSPAEELAQQQDLASYSATQSRRPGFVHVLGSIVFTTLHFPAKLVTCVGTQAVAATAYTGTFGVEGNYAGGTNGREIGEVARRSCIGSWIVTPSQVVRDYGE